MNNVWIINKTTFIMTAHGNNLNENITPRNVLENIYKKAKPLLKGIYSTSFSLGIILTIGMFLMSCATSRNTNNDLNNNDNEIVISEITTYQSSLSKSDVSSYFCSNLTEYFNTYKFYKISSEIYTEKEKQKNISITKVTKLGHIYNVEYIGSAGIYLVSFSNKRFSEAEEIFTFGSMTVLGNAIRGKVYDTFTAWIKRQEIALKANYNSYLFFGELDAAVEIENWYNRLSTTGE